MFGKKRAAEPSGEAQRQKQRRTTFEVVATVQTDKGCVREINEDSGSFVSPSDAAQLAERGSLLVVADGMGGHSAGEVASQMAVECVTRLYYENEGTPEDALRHAVEQANRQIHSAASEDESKHGMGTTCTAMALRGNEGVAAHVGDSRLYMMRGGQLYQLSEDHSAVMEMIKLGIISKEEARTHEDKNVILRALGTSPEVEVSTLKPFTVRVGDYYLLCSDGLYDLVRDEEIASMLLEAKDINAAAARMIELAKERGGHDNITVGIIAIMPQNTGVAGAGGMRPTREVKASV